MHVWAFSLVTRNFYFQSCLSTFFTWPIDKATNYGKNLAQSCLISKDLVQFIYIKLGGQNKTKLSSTSQERISQPLCEIILVHTFPYEILYLHPFLQHFFHFLCTCACIVKLCKANIPSIHEISKLPQLLSQGMLFPYIPYPRTLPYT